MTATPSGAPAARIPFIDVAKGLGILLVFYGHIVEGFIRCDRDAAVEQMRWIYCFHMPLFFFLSGLVYKERTVTAEAFLKRQTLTRLVPAWIFNLLSVVIISVVLVLTDSRSASAGLVNVMRTRAVRFGWETLYGRPFFNVLMWFLICLFVVELIQFALRKPLRNAKWLGLSMVFFATLTFLFASYHSQIADIWGSLSFDAGLLKIDFWQFSSAVAAIVFYQAGILCRRPNVQTILTGRLFVVLGGGVGLVVTLLTFNLNKPLNPVVFVAHGQYGNAVWFFVTAFAGIAFMVGLAGLLSSSRFLKNLGQITLGLMCLDGILHGVVNMPLTAQVAPYIPKDSTLLLTLACLGLTVVSVLACWPFVWLLERYAPVILGRVPGSEARKSAVAALQPSAPRS